MAEDDRNEEAGLTTDLDEDIAMALATNVIVGREEPEEPDSDPPANPPSGEIAPQRQGDPGWAEAGTPHPDHGEQSYVGHHRMVGMRTLITGGNGGIGKAVAIAFAREGADVAFTYLPDAEQDAENTVQLIEAAGSRALALPGDVQDEEFCQEAVAQTAEEFGGLNVLVNAEGRMNTSTGFEDLSTEQFDQTVKTNLYALFWIVRAALPHLNPGAAIINTSSIQGYHPSPAMIDYAATQAAINSMTFSLAESLGPRGIRVNAVAPGADQGAAQDIPLGRTGQPADVAAVFVLLASEDASYISGSVVGVTGGKHLA
ncbi:SDR family oxidoreductase [Paenarthrobacter nitroguajacolicus]|uniref:SDR family oxidoreductase n=1 Tax=Paenarthrobacter nitroguajacolicus TaxID=211146 RepID=A0A558HCG8_PAENT|nr:SDR family oxidoreductase [Paenarthrobacter nitroguajacolicus]TVU66823.1 SDR family oxidoreductase [Paenarthrobacter nitroguajacolicus]